MIDASRRGQDRRRAPLPTRVDGLPDLPADYDHALERGLAELRLELDAVARAALAAQAQLMLAWNEAINLTAIVDPAEVATRHVIDSLAAVELIRERLAPGGPARLADLGSGAGYPGLALAAAVPELAVRLVESVGKKARFLEAVVRAAGLGGRVAVAAVRAEALAGEVRRGDREPFDLVTARAVGALSDLVELALPVLALGGALIAWKRGDIEAEATTAARAATALGGGAIGVRPVGATGLEGHVLVIVEKRTPTPGGYPRDPGRRRW